jgi:hypothetical protein
MFSQLDQDTAIACERMGYAGAMRRCAYLAMELLCPQVASAIFKAQPSAFDPVDGRMFEFPLVEFIAAFTAVEQGALSVSVAPLENAYFDNPVYTFGGWTMEIFNDCQTWDGIYKIMAPNGGVWDKYEHIPKEAHNVTEFFSPKIWHWEPKEE